MKSHGGFESFQPEAQVRAPGKFNEARVAGASPQDTAVDLHASDAGGAAEDADRLLPDAGPTALKPPWPFDPAEPPQAARIRTTARSAPLM